MDEADPPGEDDGAAIARHPFLARPHRTVVGLSLPVLLSLTAEPITGLIDIAFVKELGAAPAAALGIGTLLLSSIAWVLNFLAISTQTEVARAAGRGLRDEARELCGLALALAAGLGAVLAVGVWLALGEIAGAMTHDVAVQGDAVVYGAIRLLGSPAALLMLTAAGALRGLQDMRTPLWIAAATYASNAALDPILIFGLGPIPPLGIAGAAWASALSQWIGAVWSLLAVRSRLGLPRRLELADAGRLLVVGRDLFLRTGLLMAFLWLAQRAATLASTEAGAAHQAIRQVWLFTALALDAWAATAQSLVGYFLGGGRLDLARHAAAVCTRWSLGTGVALAGAMLAATELVAQATVPPAARAVFASAWLLAALAQPLNALSFVTDGVHWGARDYRYLRNVMLAATALGALGLALLDLEAANALDGVWLVTGAWIAVRALLGTARIWPGLGAAPLGARAKLLA